MTTTYCFVAYDFVKEPKEGLVYVVKEDEAIRFLCPCDCGDLIQLSTIAEQKPKWQVNGNSIIPSVRRIVGCMSHFSITNGLVKLHP